MAITIDYFDKEIKKSLVVFCFLAICGIVDF